MIAATVFVVYLVLIICSIFGFASVNSFSLISSQGAGNSLKSKKLQSFKDPTNVDNILALVDQFEEQDSKAYTPQTIETSSCEVPDDLAGDVDTATLIKDIDKLTDILGSIVKRENNEVYELYSEFRALALARSKGDALSTNALSKMISLASKMSPEQAVCLLSMDY